MTTKEYFKNKIDWRVYNAILDACLELEDNDIYYTLCIEVNCGDNLYHIIYRYDKASNFDGYIDYDNRSHIFFYDYNLFYTMKIYNTIDYDSVLIKLNNMKNIQLIDEDYDKGFCVYRFKGKY